MTYWGNFSNHPIAPETGSPARKRLTQSSDLELKANTGYSASLFFLGCPMRPTGGWGDERSSQYLIHMVKFTNIQPHNNIIKKKINQSSDILQHSQAASLAVLQPCVLKSNKPVII